MKAKKGNTVKVHYVGRLTDGKVFDTSVGRSPLEFTIGEQEVIPAFERALPGMEVGDRRTFSVDMNDAYGPHRADLVFEVPKSELPEGLTVYQGQKLTMRNREGQLLRAFVTEEHPERVILDANHPLAGRDLFFEIELADIVV